MVTLPTLQDLLSWKNHTLATFREVIVDGKPLSLRAEVYGGTYVVTHGDLSKDAKILYRGKDDVVALNTFNSRAANAEPTDPEVTLRGELASYDGEDLRDVSYGAPVGVYAKDPGSTDHMRLTDSLVRYLAERYIPAGYYLHTQLGRFEAAIEDKDWGVLEGISNTLSIKYRS